MMELEWDPEVEAPATIAIIGAGPVGIEAAIYARFLGYFVSIFEQRRVAHRMLDWHNRPLDVTVQDCTSSLGHAALAAQNPEYVRKNPDERFTGKTYAEEYLLPLAKTDLLFDDIHFLSPVADVSRYRTLVSDKIECQERCKDEFRILVEGRHRGPWVSRTDVVIDCRGLTQKSSGMGPGGGLAIGEALNRETFLLHTPLDRKFDAKSVLGKHVCLIGQSVRAGQFASEYLEQFGEEGSNRLTWLVRPDRRHDSRTVEIALRDIGRRHASNINVIESLGVEHIQRNDLGQYLLKFLRDDDSTVEMQCDAVVSLNGGRPIPLSTELLCEKPRNNRICSSFVTNEPGYYVLRGGDVEAGAGVGLKDAFCSIRELFAMLAGRQDLDLYDIIAKQQHSTGVE
ncbi:MAG TPA: hypothetical protein VM260_28545 [Pirellula sp.]|nr:hypothetical protein [Pirellula sp.]